MVVARGKIPTGLKSKSTLSIISKETKLNLVLQVYGPLSFVTNLKVLMI